MEANDAVELTRQAIWIALVVCAPVLVAGMAIGLGIGLLQALTQIQDQTLSFVPKVLGMVLVLCLCLPWFLEMLIEYSREVIGNIPGLLMGG